MLSFLLKVVTYLSVIEEVQMIEIKQGPYIGEADKTRFSPIPLDQVRIVE